MDNSTSNSTSIYDIINGGDAGSAQSKQGITTKAFALNLATGLGLFLFELTGFFLLKSSDLGRRIYQPKTYLVQDRLRVEPVPANPFKWIYKIFTIKGEDLKAKCGLDGYFFIRLIRALIFIFVPLMVIIVTVLLPINYHGGKDERVFIVGGKTQHYNVTGLDTVSWQNVAPNKTNRYWAHLVCALLTIGWTLYRIYREKLHLIEVRQQFLSSPEHRVKASARTILITNIPKEFRSGEALEVMYDVFVGDDRSKLHVWVNRDYKTLRALVQRRRKLCHALEKEELRILRQVNKQRRGGEDVEANEKHSPPPTSSDSAPPESDAEATNAEPRNAEDNISSIFDSECQESGALWHKYLKSSTESRVTLADDGAGNWKPVSKFKRSGGGEQKSVPKIAWLRAEIARLTLQVEEMMRNLDDEKQFERQNSAFIQFDRQMSAQMAVCLVSHHLPGRMSPRYFDVAPHEIVWPNMGLTSVSRFVRTCIAILLFIGMILLWGIPTTFLGFLSQLDTLRETTSWLSWLRPWPSYVISLISGPLSAILLALLIQLVVPALCRKLAVLVGAPTRSRREIITQRFYFTFLFIVLVLVTSISSGLVATIPTIIKDPTTIPTTLATDLPKAANYFFNYLIIQGLGFSGSVLFQYLRLLYITMIWPWFTQTPREEAWLQTTIPHQMWGNVYPLFTNFAVIGLIYSVIAPVMLIIISGVFCLFWIAYRHNYYFVQRVKVDTHGMLFNNALSQMFTGLYVLELVLIGLFFLVRNTKDHVACSAQAIIMIVALVLTAAFQYLLDGYLNPLSEMLPVSLEDVAAEAERIRFSHEAPRISTDAAADEDGEEERLSEGDTNAESSSFELPDGAAGSEPPAHAHGLDGNVDRRKAGVPKRDTEKNAEDAKKTLLRLRKKIGTKLSTAESYAPGQSGQKSRRLELAHELGSALAAYPDELTDLSLKEQEAELKVAYQDPVTRQPAPVIWIPQDQAGISEDTIKQASKYGKYLLYSNEGAYLTKNNKCEITRPAPDVRPDWLLDWWL